MTTHTLRRLAAAALALCTALPAWAQPGDAAAKPVAVQMYTLRNAGSLEEQLKIVHDAGVRAVETVGTQEYSVDATEFVGSPTWKPTEVRFAIGTWRAVERTV